MPDECASIRSIARWVLPVLVGPSTAVTPAPRARASRLLGEENEIAISYPGEWEGPPPFPSLLYHNATGEKPVVKLWNESRTNRGRIADSLPVGFRSLPYLAPTLLGATKSSKCVPACLGAFDLRC